MASRISCALVYSAGPLSDNSCRPCPFAHSAYSIFCSGACTLPHTEGHSPASSEPLTAPPSAGLPDGTVCREATGNLHSSGCPSPHVWQSDRVYQDKQRLVALLGRYPINLPDGAHQLQRETRAISHLPDTTLGEPVRSYHGPPRGVICWRSSRAETAHSCGRSRMASLPRLPALPGTGPHIGQSLRMVS
jgi:hypothetical protein